MGAALAPNEGGRGSLAPALEGAAALEAGDAARRGAPPLAADVLSWSQPQLSTKSYTRPDLITSIRAACDRPAAAAAEEAAAAAGSAPSPPSAAAPDDAVVLKASRTRASLARR